MKGLLIIGMICTHALQFFAYQNSQTATWIENYGNITSFAGFLFCFGFGNQIAYFSRPFSTVVWRMIRTALKILTAFYISSIFFRIFISQTPVAWQPIRAILLLNDIPGWSEFLAGFFALTVTAIVLFRPLTWLVENKKVFWVVSFALLATTFLPYDRIQSTQLGLFIGTTKFACFPVLQYLPYYLLGMYFARYGVRFDYRIGLVSLVGTLASIVYVIRTGQLPGRFPPTLLWISFSLALVYLYFLAAGWLAKWNFGRPILTSMGRNVLVYLLVGNISLFTLKSIAGGYLYLNPWQGLGLALLIMLFAAYLCGLAAVNRQGVYAVALRDVPQSPEPNKLNA